MKKSVILAALPTFAGEAFDCRKGLEGASKGAHDPSSSK